MATDARTLRMFRFAWGPCTGEFVALVWAYDADEARVLGERAMVDGAYAHAESRVGGCGDDAPDFCCYDDLYEGGARRAIARKLFYDENPRDADTGDEQTRGCDHADAVCELPAPTHGGVILMTGGIWKDDRRLFERIVWIEQLDRFLDHAEVPHAIQPLARGAIGDQQPERARESIATHRARKAVVMRTRSTRHRWRIQSSRWGRRRMRAGRRAAPGPRRREATRSSPLHTGRRARVSAVRPIGGAVS